MSCLSTPFLRKLHLSRHSSSEVEREERHLLTILNHVAALFPCPPPESESSKIKLLSCCVDAGFATCDSCRYKKRKHWGSKRVLLLFSNSACLLFGSAPLPQAALGFCLHLLAVLGCCCQVLLSPKYCCLSPKCCWLSPRYCLLSQMLVSLTVSGILCLSCIDSYLVSQFLSLA